MRADRAETADRTETVQTARRARCRRRPLRAAAAAAPARARTDPPCACCAPRATDVRTLVGKSVLTADKEVALLARCNKEQFAAVEAGGRRVLITPHGELPNGLFLDPSGECALEVDHKALTASQSSTPLEQSLLVSLRGAAQMREAVDAAMQQYCGEFLPSGVVTTYGFVGAGTKIVCCVCALSQDLSNYWAGRWRAEWLLEVPSGGSVGQLTGKLACHVHYFEDGNVQLDDSAVHQTELKADAAVGENFVNSVRGFETQFIGKFEEIYQNMSENTLQGLRRRLPVTRTKYDWDKLSVAKLANDIQSLGNK